MKQCGVGRGKIYWEKIAKLVGRGVMWKQCSNRWTKYEDPKFDQCKRGDWTDEEVCYGDKHIFALCYLLMKLNDYLCCRKCNWKNWHRSGFMGKIIRPSRAGIK